MKSTITRRIIASYLIIILVTLSVVAVLFSLAAKRYVEGQAKASLLKDAKSIASVFKKDLTDNDAVESSIRQILKDRMKIIKGFGILDSEWAVVGTNMKLIYPRAGEEAASKVKEVIIPQLSKSFGKDKYTSSRINLEGNEYMSVVLPVKKEGSGKAIGWIVLYTPAGSLDNIVRSLMLVLLIALVFTGMIAIGFGVYFARSIARPVILLKSRAERVSKRDFNSRVEIHSGDELEELAETIDKMALELKEYDSAQKRFIQNASHELKTPLMSIQGYAEGLKDGVFDNSQKALDIIIEESIRLKTLVEELIYLSKLETLEDFYSFKTQSLNSVISESMEKLNSLAVKNNIDISLSTETDVYIKIDHDKLTQAFINILANCLRYAKSRIDISFKKSGNQVEIKLTDDGDGFDEAEIEHVFKRFYKGKKGNTGLGLAITKAIIEKHSGTIEVSNAVPGGAQFKVCLPG